MPLAPHVIETLEGQKQLAIGLKEFFYFFNFLAKKFPNNPEKA